MRDWNYLSENNVHPSVGLRIFLWGIETLLENRAACYQQLRIFLWGIETILTQSISNRWKITNLPMRDWNQILDVIWFSLSDYESSYEGLKLYIIPRYPLNPPLRIFLWGIETLISSRLVFESLITNLPMRDWNFLNTDMPFLEFITNLPIRDIFIALYHVISLI